MALLAVTLLILACSSDNGRKSTRTSAPIPSRTSSIYAVPVPGVAEEDPGLTGSGREAYRFPPNISLDVITSFYRKEMPVSKPFRQLEWCGFTPVPAARTIERVWRVPRTQNFVALQILEDQKGPLVVIIDDRDNSGRRCQAQGTS